MISSTPLPTPYREVNDFLSQLLASTGSTSEMIYGVEMVVSYLSQFMTLIPGDLIFMGTPLGAGVQVGDLVEVEIEGIGILRNEVIAQA
jgi:2-keto-4-pentenoate hydratase/2-oxohepta-3-ene-1,7-dioic acid hydratase in catechol pathway